MVAMASRPKLAAIASRLTPTLQFAAVGGSGIVVNLLVHVLATDGLGLHYLIGAIIATQFSSTWNFIFSDRWVFRRRDAGLNWAYRFAIFVGINNGALVLRGPILVTLTSVAGVHYLVSSGLSLLLVFALRYMIADAVIWRSRKARVTV